MDLSRLRAEDQTPVGKVADYLTAQGLEVKLVGSALIGDEKYNDVDILVNGPVDLLLRIRNALLLEKPLGDEYNVRHFGGPQGYGGIQKVDRFKIQAGKTSVDLSLNIYYLTTLNLN